MRRIGLFITMLAIAASAATSSSPAFAQARAARPAATMKVFEGAG